MGGCEGRRPGVNGLFESQGGKIMLWDAQQKGLGNRAVRENFIPDFSHQWDSTSTDRGKCLEGVSVDQISVAMGRSPARINISHPCLVLGLPPLQPGPSRLVAVLVSCLEMIR